MWNPKTILIGVWKKILSRKVKLSSPGLSSTPLGDDQSQLVLQKSLMFDDSPIISRYLSKTFTKDDVNRFSPALNKATKNFPTLINQYQQSTVTHGNQPQSTGVIGRIMARKRDVYDGNTGTNEWVDSKKSYLDVTNPGVVMDRVRVSQIIFLWVRTR